MSIQRRFAPIGVRFEPEQVAALTGIYISMFEYTRFGYTSSHTAAFLHKERS